MVFWFERVLVVRYLVRSVRGGDVYIVDIWCGIFLFELV